MFYTTKLRLLQEGAGCRQYVLLNSAVILFSNFACSFIYFIIILFIFAPFSRYVAFSMPWPRQSMIQGNARTITTRKRCADCILEFRISLLRWWSKLYGQASRGYANFIPRHYRDWEVISGFRPGLQNSDLGFRFSVFRLRTFDSIFDIRTFLEIFLNIPPGIRTLKRCLKGLGFKRALRESRLEDSRVPVECQ